MKTITLRDEFSKKLKEFYPKLNGDDKIVICYQLEISTSTLHRYLKGDFKKDLELAENIILKAKEILAIKTLIEEVVVK